MLNRKRRMIILNCSMLLRRRRKKRKIKNVTYRALRNRRRNKERRYPEPTKAFVRHRRIYKIYISLKGMTLCFCNKSVTNDKNLLLNHALWRFYFDDFFQKEVELRELQEQNALVLQDIAEFTIRHVEAEAYVKKLLMAKNIELPSFPPSIRSPLSPCGSSAGSLDQPLKSTSRLSAFTSSKESIGTIVKMEPQFEERMYIKIKNYWDLNIHIFFSNLDC